MIKYKTPRRLIIHTIDILARTILIVIVLGMFMPDFTSIQNTMIAISVVMLLGLGITGYVLIQDELKNPKPNPKIFTSKHTFPIKKIDKYIWGDLKCLLLLGSSL